MNIDNKQIDKVINEIYNVINELHDSYNNIIKFYHLNLNGIAEANLLSNNKELAPVYLNLIGYNYSFNKPIIHYYKNYSNCLLTPIYNSNCYNPMVKRFIRLINEKIELYNKKSLLAKELSKDCYRDCFKAIIFQLELLKD